MKTQKAQYIQFPYTGRLRIRICYGDLCKAQIYTCIRFAWVWGRILTSFGNFIACIPMKIIGTCQNPVIVKSEYLLKVRHRKVGGQGFIWISCGKEADNRKLFSWISNHNLVLWRSWWTTLGFNFQYRPRPMMTKSSCW